jgi:bisphosphoglycerate-independent phosphoglycerate mutase (AlkP superfamily)
MADENGNRDARLDRIERIMETMAADHEQFRADYKQLLIAQVLQKDAIDQLLTVTQEHTRQIAALDSRVDKLVFSIADLIQRIPPESLR